MSGFDDIISGKSTGKVMTTTGINMERIPSPATPSQPGYISTVSLRSGRYKVFAYTLNPDGSRTYLPDNCDPQTMEKVRTLVSGLLNAHDSKCQQSNEPPFEIRGMDSRGLIKQDNTLVSHDFTIQPYSQQIADQMANSLNLYGRPCPAASIKAQDLWNTLDDAVRTGINTPALYSHPSPSANPSQPTPSPMGSIPSSSSLQPTPSPAGITPSSPLQPTPSSANAPNHPPQTPVTPPPCTIPPTSIDQDLANIDLQQPNWYEQIPLRTKLRIVRDVSKGRSPLGGVYEKVWNHFIPPQGNGVLTALANEEKRLAREARRLPSAIPSAIRQKAESIYDFFKTDPLNGSALKQKIHSLIGSDFPHKEQLYRRVRQQALAEGKRIEEGDQQWAQNHYADDPRLFVQALARWLDNDSSTPQN